ncbi:hypothetical protein [Actinocatenispora thailandica]|nr:hypothetical protein [Actinocatenispora thailandica]
MAVEARRFELSAPDWIVELVRLKPAAISWLDVLRMAVSVPTPLAVFLALGAPSLGTFAGMGAMATALADRGGPSGSGWPARSASASPVPSVSTWATSPSVPAGRRYWWWPPRRWPRR